ncbi:5'-methylthioadenosine/adenosylhomocysteine nucleosidase [Comamonadaceae bacterium BS-T2-15]|uniref:adenosylhomocysteine nucleosidase n=2 Tax=Scleromatobacter humisilvae TaxID=2897159 RepID=A0A9X1YPB7_9BURK|nr:5'-methylthioadenosine/adenosylhomocysteine nucleosidase [Scleromatobacter humisilvae]
MHEEIAALRPCLEHARTERRAGRDFHIGRLDGHDVVLVRCGIGKVAAATTAAVLLDAFDARALLFTGVAGGLGDGVRVGDIVVATTLLQHDMNAEPLFPRWEVPLTGRARFDADPAWSARLAQASRTLAASNAHAEAATIHEGLVVSGDRFVATRAESDQLRALLPEALAVEMEGAAVAQVCHDFARPFGVVRTISDRADDAAHGDFQRFVRDVAAPYSRDIVRAALRLA